MLPSDRSVELDPRVYLSDALQRTVKAYAECCDVRVSGGAPISIDIKAKPGMPDETVDEFLSFLLGVSLEMHLAALAERP